MQFLLLMILFLNALFFLVINLRQSWMAWCVWRQNCSEATEVSPMLRQDARLWPVVAVLVPAHNEERVILGCLQALDKQEYPPGKLQIWVVNDRSTDATSAIAHQFAQQSRHDIRVFDRGSDTLPGKPAAIGDVLARVDAEVVVFFDADYTPGPDLVKRLVQPFSDPQVGATMGRVTPENTNTNVLTRLLDLERRAGYGVDQQARQILGWLPQFGGTVGGIRLSALRDVGGWYIDVLAEDTDLTYRLYLKGYRVAYLPHAACYEESPETWEVRYRQVRRWAMGHDQCLARYAGSVWRSKIIRGWAKWDALFVLTLYLYPVVNMLGLLASLIYPVFYDYPPVFIAAVPILGLFVGVGNLSNAAQIGVAAYHDQQLRALRALPLLPLSSSISSLACIDALFKLAFARLKRQRLGWDKTLRFRSADREVRG